MHTFTKEIVYRYMHKHTFRVLKQAINVCFLNEKNRMHLNAQRPTMCPIVIKTLEWGI